jgi:hypothetical protein
MARRRPSGKKGVVKLRLVAIASLALALGIGTVSAEEMKPPRVSSVAVDWGRLSGDFQTLDEGRLTGATGDQANGAPAAAAEAIARINLATGDRFANIAASPVPGMSRPLLNIEKRTLPRVTLRGVGLANKDAVG